jgi:branched-chain amino acid transport system substrate-binding protein
VSHPSQWGLREAFKRIETFSPTRKDCPDRQSRDNKEEGGVMKRVLRTISLITVFAGLAILAFCVSASAAGKTLKIGIVAPYTGANARVGEELKDIHTMAFDRIGWKIGDYKIEPVWIDDESDPEKAVRAFKDAVLKEKIQAALSGYHSSVTVALMDLIAQYKIPYFFPQNESSVIVKKFKSDPVKYAYHQWKGRPNPTKLIVGYDIALFKDAISKGAWKPGNKKFSVMCEDTDYGRDFCASFKGMVQDKGWSLAAEDYVPLDTTDVYPILSKLQSQSPSLIFISMSAPAVATGIIKQVKEVGLKGLVISHGLGWIGEWYQMTGDAGDYILDMMQKYRTPKQIEYRDAFKKKFNISPSASLAISYDYANFFVEICKRALQQYGKLDSESIFKIGNDEVSTGKLTYKGGLWYKELKWDRSSLPEMVVGEGYYLDPVVQYFGGEGTIIWPDDLKEAGLKVR